MRVEIFTLCDASTVDSSGKMNLLGSFDRIFAGQVPVVWGPCAIAIKMRFERLEEGMKRIRISFIDADGNSVMPMINAQVEVRLSPSDVTATSQVVLVIQQIALPNYGEYSIDLAINERQEGSIPLYILQPPSAPPLPPAEPEQPSDS